MVAGSAALAGVLVLFDASAGWPEWLFGTFLVLLAAHVVRVLERGVHRARRERRRAVELDAARPDAVALAALEEERRRLGDEIGSALRGLLAEVRAEVLALDPGDPVTGLRRIHARTKVATSELRRQLGVLRDAESEPSPTSEADAGRVPRRDLVLAAVMTALAPLEVSAYLVTELGGWSPWVVVLSTVAAATVVGRSVAPASACLACAAVFAVGSLVGEPVLGGFWFFGTLGGLVWSVAARARPRSAAILSGCLLVVVVLETRRLDDGDNLPFTAVLLGVAAVGGCVARAAARREADSKGRAAERQRELDDAARVAVTAGRADFARELHDTVSHAVGLIAMQSSAALVSWPQDPGRVHQCLAVIDETARAALEELDQLGAPVDVAPRSVADVRAVVDRIRAAGARVDLTVVGELPTGTAQVVHRVVQESLTNAIRHAPGSGIRVEVTAEVTGVAVRVSDDGPTATPRNHRGYGLVGLAERVVLLGGAMRTGPVAGGGYVVEVTLPSEREVVAP